MNRVAAFALLLGACGVPEGSDKVIVFGHGGLGPDADWPMNTRGSISGCLNEGSDGVEIDVQLTYDTVLVCFHDEDLSAATNCSGRVNAHTWRDLLSCVYPASTHSVEGMEIVRIPRLAAVDSALMDLRWQHLTLDCKLFAFGGWSNYIEAYAAALGSLIERHGLHGRVNIECMDIDFLVKVRQRVHGMKTFLYATEANAGIDSALVHGFAGITIDHRSIDRDQVERAREAGLLVAVFGTNGDRSHRAALRLRPDMIQTDDVRGLLALQGR